MKLTSPLCVMALLFSAGGCASEHLASQADKAYIAYMDKYIQQPDTPFPGKFNTNMVLSSIRRAGNDVFISLTSTNSFEQKWSPIFDVIMTADMMSESYFYRLDFLYNPQKTGVCQDPQFNGAKGNIQILYDYLDIQYKTQVTRPLEQICGMKNSDGKHYPNDFPLKVAQRNLFSSYLAIMERSLNQHLKTVSNLNPITLKMGDNETLVFTYQENRPVETSTQEKLTQALFGDNMCQFFTIFKLLDIMIETKILDEKGTYIGMNRQNTRALCGNPVKNIFNLK